MRPRALLIIVSILAIFLAGCGRLSHPGDKAMLRDFERNEKEFETLVTMLRADQKLQRLASTWSRPGNPASIGIPPERIDSYRRLFRKLRIPKGVEAFHNPEHFDFIVSTYGLSISGSSKGYVYLEEKPDLIVTNLSTYWSPDGKSFTAYRHIKGNWYLYFDFED